MRARKPIPEALKKALHEICEEVAKKRSRLWLDAEQQLLQPGLDEWAISLMRRFNRNGKALVYNTIQAYLKNSKANVDRHIALAANEGWTVGIKLVRGAYIEHETRSLIHETKEDTDRNYDMIVDMLLSQSSGNLPPTALFLATHNATSTEKALSTHRQRVANNQPTAFLECGQVQGMADELSCKLVHNYETSQQGYQLSADKAAAVPRAFKCLVWGSVAECMGYLYRRAIESRGAVERTSHMVDALKQELKRRVFG